jgi:hypothetical protein
MITMEKEAARPTKTPDVKKLLSKYLNM